MTPLRQSKARSDEPSVSILDAALEALGSDAAREVNEQSRVVFSEMFAVGKRLRSALTGPSPGRSHSHRQDRAERGTS